MVAAASADAGAADAAAALREAHAALAGAARGGIAAAESPRSAKLRKKGGKRRAASARPAGKRPPPSAIYDHLDVAMLDVAAMPPPSPRFGRAAAAAAVASAADTADARPASASSLPAAPLPLASLFDVASHHAPDELLRLRRAAVVATQAVHKIVQWREGAGGGGRPVLRYQAGMSSDEMAEGSAHPLWGWRPNRLGPEMATLLYAPPGAHVAADAAAVGRYARALRRWWLHLHGRAEVGAAKALQRSTRRMLAERRAARAREAVLRRFAPMKYAARWHAALRDLRRRRAAEAAAAAAARQRGVRKRQPRFSVHSGSTVGGAVEGHRVARILQQADTFMGAWRTTDSVGVAVASASVQMKGAVAAKRGGGAVTTFDRASAARERWDVARMRGMPLAAVVSTAAGIARRHKAATYVQGGYRRLRATRRPWAQGSEDALPHHGFRPRTPPRAEAGEDSRGTYRRRRRSD